MRVLSNDVEYFDLIRDRPPMSSDHLQPDDTDYFTTDRGLRKSLWYFNGQQLCCWIDTEDLVRAASSHHQAALPEPMVIPTDFYPTSTILARGVVLGLDAELVQPHDANFASFRLTTKVGPV